MYVSIVFTENGLENRSRGEEILTFHPWCGSNTESHISDFSIGFTHDCSLHQT